MSIVAEDTIAGRRANWKIWLQKFIGAQVSGIEIGSYDGDSAVWFLKNICINSKSSLFCIDPWSNTSEPYASRNIDMSKVYETFLARTREFNNILHQRGYSGCVLSKIFSVAYDFAYVDGSHFPVDVLRDSVLLWPTIRKGGIVIWDDYAWQFKGPLTTPKIALDAFLSVYEGKYRLIHKGYQVAVEKLGD